MATTATATKINVVTRPRNSYTSTGNSFSVSMSGVYPQECYIITPNDYNLNVPTRSNTLGVSGIVPAENIFRFFNNPTNDIDQLQNYYNQINYSYGQSSYIINPDGQQIRVLQNNTPTSDTFIWYTSSLRSYNLGQIFNFFNINFTKNLPSSNTQNPATSLNLDYRSYLLYPQRLFLYPISAAVLPNNKGFALTTSAVLISPTTFYFNSSTAEIDAYNTHLNYQHTTPTIVPVISNSNINLYYGLSAYKNVVNNVIIPWTYQIYSFNDIIEPTYATIRPDSTFVTYGLQTPNSYAPNGVSLIAQEFPEETPFLKRGFRSSFVENFSLNNKNNQTFQLVQSTLNPNVALEDITNATATFSVNLTANSFIYNTNHTWQLFNPVTLLTGVNSNPLKFRYIAESPYIHNSTYPVTSGFSIKWNNSTTFSLNSSVSPNVLLVTWNVPYPIHYYSYKLGFTNPNFSSPSDLVNLNFNLSSWVTNATTSSIFISSCLVSDFNILTLDLPTYAAADTISLNIVDKVIDPMLVNSLSCFYGQYSNQPYDLINSPYVPVSSLSGFQIVYSPNLYGEMSYTFRTSLSSSFGTLLSSGFGYVSDSPYATYVKFAPNITPTFPKYPLSITVLNEQQDIITLDISSLTADPQFPSINLLGSLISWSFTDNSPLSSNVTVYSVADNGYVTYINPNSAIPFDQYSWTINVSGYGPSQAIISLSSQSYNQVATVSTYPNIFNYFANGVLTVGATNISVTNLSTVNVTLTAGVPYNGIIYPMPSSANVYWTWQYDGNDNPATQPISSYYLNNKFYNYGVNGLASSLSSINSTFIINSATNPYSVHNVIYTLNYHQGNNIAIGSYDFVVYDYPNNSYFNADFTVSNYNYPTPIIANTRSKNNIITRPNTDLNYYTFNANSDVLPSVSASSFNWIINDNTGYNSIISATNIFSISSINYQINSNASVTTVTLCALNASIQGWNITGSNAKPQTITASVTINTIPLSTFNTPTQIIVYPPYAWLQGNNGYLTILNQSNYTLAISPTAYANKISNSQNFYFSANRLANEYDYTFGLAPSTVYVANSSVSLIDVPYINDFYTVNGCYVSLSAFDNTYYPKINGVQYTSVNSNSSLYTGYFNITANTIPFGNVSNTQNPFSQSPKLIPFDRMNLGFSAVDVTLVYDFQTVTQLNIQYIPITAIDLDNNIYLGIYQKLTPVNSGTTPVILSNKGTVTYSISTSQWFATQNVPAINGFYKLFYLYVGDATQPYTVSPYTHDTINIGASATYYATISSSTFNNYPNITNTNLWTSAIQTATAPVQSLAFYITSVNPEIYISNYYSLTGESIMMQFQTPVNSNNLQITSYTVYYGDGNSEQHLINDVIEYSYASQGVYELSYTVNYNNGQNASFTLTNNPITIYNEWPVYDQSDIRLLSETQLTLPWSLDQIKVQPNEFGVSDIFNTTMNRLYDCLDYLSSNIQTINTDSPTLYYGWLGSTSNNLSRGLSWHSVNYDKVNYTNPQNATANGLNYFTSLSSVVETDQHLFVLDGTKFRAFSSGKILQEIFFDNISQVNQLLIKPVSMDIDTVNNNVYIADSYKNKIYKLNLSFDYINEINIQLTVGNFGSITDPNKFNSPQEILYKNNNVFVLDYNNLCVKQYTQDLNWLNTYYISNFQIERPIHFAVHTQTMFVYIVTNEYNVYVFDNKGNYISLFSLNEAILNKQPIVKMFFDENGDFIYVVTKNNVFKYTIIGYFISNLSIPYGSTNNANGTELTYTSGNYTTHRGLLFTTSNSIIKCQDIVTLFKVGQGLPYNFWSRSQCLVYDDELVQDVVYNRSLTRLVQNIKGFRDIFDSRFVIATEQTSYGTVRYFTKTPISVSTRPVFSNDIENENVQVGTNEFNIPQVLNREIVKIYEAFSYLATFLSITDIRVLQDVNAGCSDPFCWSWKAMSCYNLSLPVIRICNINPITYAELESSYPIDYIYAPTNNWGLATAACCELNVSPLG